MHPHFGPTPSPIRYEESPPKWFGWLMAGFILVGLAGQAISAPPVAQPLDDQSSLILDEHFISVVDGSRRVPLVVAYTVTAKSASGSGKARNFKTLVKSQSLERSDYLRSGFDIGHLAPLGSFDGVPEFDDVNYLENCAPQKPNLNRGPWLKLENRERDLAEKHGSVFVVCGTMFGQMVAPLKNADEPHTVPSGFWKRITWFDGEQLQVETYIFGQEVSRWDSLDYFILKGE